MRDVAFLATGLLLLLIQGNLHPLIAPLELHTGLHGWTPSLLLPLVVFLGVHELSMARGAVLAFCLGHALDLLASAPIWLYTFVYVALWWLARVVGVRLTAQTVPTQMALAFSFALVQGVIVFVLLVIFGSDPYRPVGIALGFLPNAVATALVSPVVFRIAQQIHVSTGGPGRSSEEGSA